MRLRCGERGARSVERVAISALAVGAISVVGAALALTPWLALLDERGAGWRRARVPRRGRWSRGSCPRAVVMTATARRTLGPALCRSRCRWRSALLFAIARAPRIIASLVGASAIAGELALPRRLYPSVRVLLVVVAFVALACARRGRFVSIRAAARRSAHASATNATTTSSTRTDG